jgi:uncharacterized protein YbcC (UPF0753/DUF2309 family)
MRGVSEELRRQQRESWSAEQTVVWALRELGVPEVRWPLYIEHTLLSLRGWAGMIWQLEIRPDTAPVDPPPARLVDYLAVQLLLDLHAARFVVRKELGIAATWADLPRRGASSMPSGLDLELVYEAFLTAQLAGLGPSEIAGADTARRWLAEIRAFDSNERRRLLHLAYERRHRIGVLDGIVGHCRQRPPSAKTARFQAVFCIDDREESLRRHLEEIRPDVQTFGYAGFFGVTMAYQGIEDIRPRPLCPVAVRPTHYVTERALDETEAAAFAGKRRIQGKVTHSIGLGSKMLTRGGLLSGFMGFLAVLPLIGRSLFPRRTERFAHWAVHRTAPAPRTRLCLERADGEERADGLAPGYTIEEMAGVVGTVLAAMGMDRHFCPLVLIVGHGSSSLNNPHEAAHDCGATGGGRGGPNARAFAQMANDSRVRAQLRKRGLWIPDETWFVGAYHNTCDDSMRYYEEDLVPACLSEKLSEVQRALEEACELDAHERCRRFESASLAIDPPSALIHAEAHAYDLAQPRPEYGHATNAVCIVGRRERTRGLFLDRRAFLVSYDPARDPSGSILAGLLRAVGPVGAGINLEYYFSFIDPTGYGCGTKLPHNIVGLIGVMDGHASDLRTGLPWQMVEIHEPVRLLTIVEAETRTLERILGEEPGLANLVVNEWIQLVAWDPKGEALAVYEKGSFVPYVPENPTLAVVRRSKDFYSAKRGHLSPAHITSGLTAEVRA